MFHYVDFILFYIVCFGNTAPALTPDEMTHYGYVDGGIIVTRAGQTLGLG